MSGPGYGSRERELVGPILATKHGACFREQGLEVFVLAIKRSFMGKHEKGIVGVSNDLCRTLLETEQSVGIHSDLLIRKIKMPTAEQLSNSLGL